MLSRSGKSEYLFWRWGATTAVRCELPLPDKDSPNAYFTLHEAINLAIIISSDEARKIYALHTVPLLIEPQEGALPPATLPFATAPLVSACELYRGPLLPGVTFALHSNLHAPLVRLEHHMPAPNTPLPGRGEIFTLY